MNLGIISGAAFMLIGVVVLGIGQRLSEEVATLYTAVRRRVGMVRRRATMPQRMRPRAARRPEAPPTMILSTPTTASSEVAQVIDKLHQGAVSEGEKQQLAAALIGQEFATLTPRATEQDSYLAAQTSEADTAEALTLAVVASTAVKNVGERGVLAMRLTGIGILIIGAAIALVNVFPH